MYLPEEARDYKEYLDAAESILPSFPVLLPPRMHEAGPVSYTHLDVYKRQGRICAPQLIALHQKVRTSHTQLQVFVVVVRQALVMLVDSTTQDGVGQRVALCLYFPAAVDELMTCLLYTSKMRLYSL